MPHRPLPSTVHSQGSSVRPSNMASQADATLVKYCQATRRLKAWSGGAGEREDKASGHLHGHLPPETSPDPSVAVAWPTGVRGLWFRPSPLLLLSANGSMRLVGGDWGTIGGGPSSCAIIAYTR
jgi:hypothetical protein